MSELVRQASLGDLAYLRFRVFGAGLMPRETALLLELIDQQVERLQAPPAVMLGAPPGDPPMSNDFPAGYHPKSSTIGGV